MSTISNSESWMSSSWWSSSSWLPNTTQDPSSTLPTSSESSSSSQSWTNMDFTSTTYSEPSLTSTWTLSTSSSSLALIVVLSPASSLPGTHISNADSMSSTSESAPVKFKTGHIIAMSIGSFVGLFAMGGLFVYFALRRRKRHPQHQRLDSGPDEMHDGDFATNTHRDNLFGAAVRDRGSSLGERMSSRRILDRSYYNARWSPSDGGANSTTPLLQPQLSQSDSRGSEQETSSFALGPSDIHESPISQSRPGSIHEESPGLSSPSGPPRYSRILPLAPILRPPRPLPTPENPRLLAPQRRSNSIQIRMQTRPPLISSSTTSLPLSSSPPTLNLSSSPSSSSGSDPSPPASSSPPLTSLPKIEPFLDPVSQNLPPLRPQRRTADSITIPPSSWSPSDTSLSPVSPFRPTPSVSFRDTQHPTTTKPKEFMKLKFRRNQHARNRSGQSGSLPLTSESFRCAGEKAMHDEDRGFFAHEDVFTEPSASATQTTEPEPLIDT